jgi:hypothetical protein
VRPVTEMTAPLPAGGFRTGMVATSKRFVLSLGRRR